MGLRIKRTPEEIREQNRVRGRRHYWKHRELKKEYGDSFAGRFRAWKARAKYRGIPWELTRKDLEERPKICFFTGRTLTLESNTQNTISLDRLDSSQGYTKENTVFCCAFVNTMKYTSTVEQFLATCREILSHCSPV